MYRGIAGLRTAVDLYAAEEQRVGECHMIAGTEFRLVTTPLVWSH